MWPIRQPKSSPPHPTTRMSTHKPPANAAVFRRKLLRWFRRHGRDLPWRRTRDPYRVLVSEFMLQQTQVSRVEAYYTRFLAQYPTIHALAAAPSRTVQESWSGLGYYRRATNLHQLAKDVVRTLDGVLPQEPERLQALPGVGRYTAGAVAAFAFERPYAAVDTNVARVIQRAFHPRTPRSPTHPKLWQTAQALQPRRGSAWAFNQALMELGAVICRVRTPECRRCPVKQECKTGKNLS